jgi:hypothetical protein
MIDWQSHMTPEEAATLNWHRETAEAHQREASEHYRQIRLIAQRCRQRARKAKGE